MALLQRSPLGSVPNDHELHCVIKTLHGAVCRDGKPDVFFRGHPPHIEDDQVMLTYAPALSQRLTAACRCKQLAIDTAAEDTDIFETTGVELVAEIEARYERAGRAVMKPA